MAWISKTATVVVIVSAAYILLRKLRRLPISDIRGPDNLASFFLGHFKFFYHSEANVVESRFLSEYGGVVRIKGLLSGDRLWIADPKALHYILQATSYLYVKPSISREISYMIADEGLLWADGETHIRQRKGTMPAFGLTASRELLPRFIEVIDTLDGMWKDMISDTPDGSVTLDAVEWLGRATLDVIGKAAFEYEFGALERLDNPITETYLNFMDSALGTKPPPVQLFVANAGQYLPYGAITWLFEKDNGPGNVKIRENRKQAHAVARKLIDAKRENILNGEQGKDVLSLLIKGSGPGTDGMLKDFEMVSQIRTLMFAGQETTAKSLALGLWELAKNPEVQTKLRAELDTNVLAKGNADFTAAELENMPYLNAVLKEILRFHNIVPEFIRQASEDSVLPLSTPITGSSGRIYRELNIPKGTIVHVSLTGYNINPDVWGSDAEVFRPERWLQRDAGKAETPVGVYGNLLTFSAGSRSCIGWRFAVIEMQAFMARLVREFQFSEVEVGEENKGPQLPLKVSAVRRN